METLHLLETVATHNPEALVEGDASGVICRLLQASDRPEIRAACIRTIEKMNRVPGATAKLVEAGLIDVRDAAFHPRPRLSSSPSLVVTALYSLMSHSATCSPTQPLLEVVSSKARAAEPAAPAAGAGGPAPADDDDDDKPKVVIDPNYLEPSFRVLDRLCRVKEYAEAIREKAGLEKLSTALNLHADNATVASVGSRILTNLASSNVADLVARMESSVSLEEKEFLAELLANLATEVRVALRPEPPPSPYCCFTLLTVRYRLSAVGCRLSAVGCCGLPVGGQRRQNRGQQRHPGPHFRAVIEKPQHHQQLRPRAGPHGPHAVQH